ncbi:MAG: hypothetical protein RJA21_1136, partial [Gemmatimonadota bacterium]
MFGPKTLLMLLAVASLSTQMPLHAQALRPDADPRIEKLVASVSQPRLQATATTLAGFGTRSTLSDTVSTTRGIGAARRWIYSEFTRMSPKLQVSYDRHMLAQQGRITREVELVNVVAVLPGKSARRVYITGHYDTVNSRRPAGADATATAAGAAPGAPNAPLVRPTINDNADAPGANDDGSGTSLTMELARVFAESGIEFDATLV